MDIVLFLLRGPASVSIYSLCIVHPKGSLQSCWRTLAAERAGHRPETHHGYLLAVPVSGAGGRIPEEAVKSPLCTCRDGAGLPRPGVTTSMREPGRLVEFQRVP